MNDNNQIKHNVWWIIKTIGETGTYAEFINRPLSDEVCEEISALIDNINIDK
jgi:hypothetical protein